MPEYDAVPPFGATHSAQPAGVDGPTRSVSKPASPNADRHHARTDTWRALFFLTKRSDVPLLSFAIATSVSASIANPAQAFIIGKVFDGFIRYTSGQLDGEALLVEEQKWILGLTCIACGSWLFHSLELTLWVLFGERQAEQARRELYSMLSTQEISWYDTQEHGVSALLVSLDKQVRDMQLAVSQPMGGFIATISTALISLGQAFYNSWSLTLVTLATSPLVIVVLWYFSSGMQAAIAQQQAELQRAQKSSLDALSSIDTVKCYNAEDMELEKYTCGVSAAAQFFYTIANRVGMQMGCLTFLVQAMFVQAFYYGGVLISRGDKTSAEVVTTFFSAIAAFQAAQGILPQVVVLEKGRSSASMLQVFLAESQELAGHNQDTGNDMDLEHSSGIVLDSISFSYLANPTQLALKNVCLTFAAGQTTFVIGKSGSGKSTIGQLLVRFYDPDEGCITLGGQHINSMSQAALRDVVTLVEQTSVLFNDTIIANLMIGRPEPFSEREKIHRAFEFALLQGVISDLPQGMDTIVGKGGASLSGGQCQRVALARARLRDTPILILDESTSALDQISRDLIMAAVRTWRRGKTTVVITHEVRQVEAEDFVVVMENGQVVQQGYRSHIESLLASPFQRFIKTTPEPRSLALAPDESRRSRKAHMQHRFQARRAPSMMYRPVTRPFRLSSQFLADMPDHSTSLAGSSESARSSSCSPDDWYSQAAALRSDNVSCDLELAHSSGVQSDTQQLKEWLVVAGKSAALYKLQRRRGLRRLHQDLSAKDSIEQDPGDSLHQDRSLYKILSKVWPVLAWKSRVYLIAGFWGGTVHAVCSPIFAYVLSKLLGLYAVPTDHSQQSLIYSLAILALAAVDGVHFYLCRFMLEKTAQMWVDTLRHEAMARLLQLPKAFYDRPENNVFSITQDLDRSGEEMRNLLGRFAGLIYIALVIIVSSVIWALTAHWKMTLFALATGPYILLVTYAFSKGSERLEALSDDASRRVAYCLEETFSAVRTVRALNLEAHFRQKFDTSISDTAMAGRRRALITGLLYGWSDSASSFSIAFVFWIGSKLVSNGESVAAILQVFVVLVFAITNVVAILDYIPQISSAKVTASRVLQLANMDAHSHETSGDVGMSSFGSVTFNSLTFCYELRKESAALKDVTFAIHAGTSVAIVGGSGSGKSTVAKLLLKLYAAPDDDTSTQRCSAALKISGRAIQDIDTASLRRTIGVVLQTNPIFPFTIARNIAYGLPSGSPLASHANIVQAAKQAGIVDFVNSLPNGFDTRIGDGGMGLSGGQVQRIAIARALVRRPSALIFDEATSALDAESASKIRATIQQLVEDEASSTTVIIITHSQEMIEIAEQVVVLDNGSVVEVGAFSDLIKHSGPLTNLLNSGVWAEDGM